MSKSGGIMKMIILGLGVAALCVTGYASDKVADDAKMYRNTLESMKDQGFGNIISKLQEWKFEALDTWQAENPTPKEVGKHNRSKVKFSKQEISEIFGPGGKFKVVIYNKLIGTDASHIGEIDEMGMSVMKDATINLEQYSVIRLVFRDGKLIHFRVWPKLDQSGFSGGTWLRR
jgi:hypothetical protein